MSQLRFRKHVKHLAWLVFAVSVIPMIGLPSRARGFSASVFDYRITDITGAGSTVVAADTFEDGTIDPATWAVQGTASESGGALRLTSPGVPLPVPSPLVGEATQVVGAAHFRGVNDRLIESTWSPVPLAPGDYISMGIVSFNASFRVSDQIQLVFTNVTPAFTEVFGGTPGLHATLTHMTIDSFGNPTFLPDQTQPIASAPFDDILLRIAIPAAGNSFTALILANSGNTVIAQFGPRSIETSIGHVDRLIAGSIIPEPTTATLLGLGVASLAIQRPRAPGRRSE